MNNICISPLEARVNTTGGNDPCAMCDRWLERTRGATETYLAGTEDWVCASCAYGIDADLAQFAHDPAARVRTRKRHDGDYFGACPVCGSNGIYLNVGKTHWKICERHGLRWRFGHNLISTWQLDTEEDWIRNDKRLDRCREAEPYYPELRHGKIWRTLISLAHSIRRLVRNAVARLLRPVMPHVFEKDEPPF